MKRATELGQRLFPTVVVGFLVGTLISTGSASGQIDIEETLIGCDYQQITGTGGEDHILGSTEYRDDVSTYAGRDEAFGLGCGDWLTMGSGMDFAGGAHGNDLIHLNDGHDEIPWDYVKGEWFGGGKGGAGHDSLYGGEGRDGLHDDTGDTADRDHLFGEGVPGQTDWIFVQDGDTLDIASGGDGAYDHCVVDKKSEANSDCEYLHKVVEEDL